MVNGDNPADRLLWSNPDFQLIKSLIAVLCPAVISTKTFWKSGGIRKPEVLVRLLQALAWQVGSEVSYNELVQNRRNR
jgi:hypothetical protein